MKKRIAIIGGGISGLTAAYTLQKQAGDKAEIFLFESKSRLGGVIETEMTREGFILEGGPDCFLSKKNAAAELCQALGLETDLIPTQEAHRRSSIYSKGRLRPVPAGFYLTAPSKLSTLFMTPLLSLFGKIRAAFDLWIPARKNPDDESIASFIRRRLGREVFERIGQPMVGGIYGGDPGKISINATMPQFKQMERDYGSVIRGIRAQQDKAAETASGPRYSLFLSLRQGMEQIVRALALELNDVKIYTACAIETLEIIPKSKVWNLGAADGRYFETDIVLIALPAHAAARLVKTVAPGLSGKLERIPYESMATVNLLYRKSDIPVNLNGAGFVVPKAEKVRFSACTFTHQKFEGRVTEEWALLRAFVGGALYQEEFRLDDHAMEVMVREELEKILKITARPQSIQIRRYPKSMPQYQVGHRKLVEDIFKDAVGYPGLFLTGNAYEGIGIPDCIEAAQRAAEAILRRF